MPQTGYTPIPLYKSTTAGHIPVNTNLVAGELAINMTDEKLYFKNTGGTVKMIASTAVFTTTGAGGYVLAISPTITGHPTIEGVTSTGATGTGKLVFGSSPTLSGVTLSDGTANGVAYLNSSNVLTAGNALTFDGTNLSVGGSNFQQKLNVVVPVFTSNASGGIRIGDSGNNYYSDLLVTTDSSANPFITQKFATHTLSQYAFGGGNNYWAWYANNAEQMRLTSTGLGIGTSSPAYKLDVVGTMGVSGAVTLSGGTANGVVYLNSSKVLTSGSGLVYNSSGNLGLGVVPSAWGSFKALDVSSYGGLFGYTNQTGITGNSYYNGSNWIYKATAAATQYQQLGSAHAWFTAPSGTAGNAISFTQAMTLDASGNLLVGTTTGSYKITCNGQPGANGYTAWTNYSDERLKENIVDFVSEPVLNKICELRPVSFNYNDKTGFDEESRKRTVSGFIAQEMLQVFPDMVGRAMIGEDEYLDTNLSNLTLYLVKAIQEQQKMIEELKSKIEKL